MICDITLDGDNVTSHIDAGKVSRLHCAFKRIVNKTTAAQTVLEDYSTNGTFVNGSLVGKGNSQMLLHRDVIALTCCKKRIFMYLDSQYSSPGFPTEICKKYVVADNLGKG